jgi:hypothetical protein
MAMGLTWPAIMLLLLLGGRHPGLPLPLSGPVDLLWALVIGAVVAPACEELLFRGFLQSSLRSYGLHVMVWTAAVCFGLFHLDPLRFIPTTALGVVYGYLAASYRSVYPSMAAHGTNNFIALVLGYLGGAGGAQSALTYEAMEREMIRQLSETGTPLGGMPPEQVVLLGVVASMVAMLAGGLALALVVALILRVLIRRAAAAGAATREAAEEPAAAGRATVAPGAEPPPIGTSMPEPGEEPAPGGRRAATELLRIPWVGGIAAVAVLFWGLALWSYFRAAPEEAAPPDPPAVRTDGGGDPRPLGPPAAGAGGRADGRDPWRSSVTERSGAGRYGRGGSRWDGAGSVSGGGWKMLRRNRSYSALFGGRSPSPGRFP